MFWTFAFRDIAEQIGAFFSNDFVMHPKKNSERELQNRKLLWKAYWEAKQSAQGPDEKQAESDLTMEQAIRLIQANERVCPQQGTLIFSFFFEKRVGKGVSVPRLPR